MPDKEQKQTTENDVHIYKDDYTGDMYIWDGSQLVKIGNSTPQIGDRGDKEFQDKEEEERKKQIEKEREEDEEAENEEDKEKGKGSGDPDEDITDDEEQEGDDADDNGSEQDGNNADNNKKGKPGKNSKGSSNDSDNDNMNSRSLPGDYEETEEERQQRLDDIRNMLSDDAIAADIENETRQKVDKELRKKKAAEKKEKEKYTSSMQRFRESLRRFIANEVQEIRDRTFKREDPSYEGSGIIRPGRMIDDNTKIPKINVYFDQSVSWDSDDIRKGEEAIGILNNYVKRGEITIDLYYFANHIHDTPDACRGEGGTGAGPELIQHVVATKPDNVIVMTDEDFDYQGNWEKVSPIKVKGAVWLLFKRGARSDNLQKYLRGKKQTRVFDFR